MVQTDFTVQPPFPRVDGRKLSCRATLGLNHV